MISRTMLANSTSVISALRSSGSQNCSPTDHYRREQRHPGQPPLFALCPLGCLGPDCRYLWRARAAWVRLCLRFKTVGLDVDLYSCSTDLYFINLLLCYLLRTKQCGISGEYQSDDRSKSLNKSIDFITIGRD